MLVGYARVSTQDQHLALQIDALHKAGCERIFEDKISGSKTDRVGLANAISHLRKDDTLVVWKLDRLGRSVKDLVRLIRVHLNKRQKSSVGFYAKPTTPRLSLDFRPPIFTLV